MTERQAYLEAEHKALSRKIEELTRRVSALEATRLGVVSIDSVSEFPNWADMRRRGYRWGGVAWVAPPPDAIAARESVFAAMREAQDAQQCAKRAHESAMKLRVNRPALLPAPDECSATARGPTP